MSATTRAARPVAGSPFTPESIVNANDDLDRVVREIPADYVIRGLFLSRLVAQLAPAAWAEIKPTLASPPRVGRYLPFSDYPQSDYHRLLLVVARAQRPESLPLAERLRRVAHEDFAVIANTMLGRVILSAVGDARAALLRTPSVYSSVSSGSWTAITASEVDADHVAIEFVDFHTNWAYQLGQFEGIVANFGVKPRIEVAVGERYLRFVVAVR